MIGSAQEETPVLASGLFRMGRKRFARYLFFSKALIWCGVIGALTIPALIAAFFGDIRWIIVFFMLICLVAPMLTVFLYFYHGLNPVTVLNTVTHKILFSPSGLTVEIFDDNKDEDNNPVYVLRYKKFIPYSAFGKVLTDLNAFSIAVKDSDKGFLWIPIEAFSSREDFTLAFTISTSRQFSAFSDNSDIISYENT